MEKVVEQVQPNTISYWEERTINIGQYESRKLGLSVTQKVTYINNLDKKVTIKESDSVRVYPNMSNEKNYC